MQWLLAAVLVIGGAALSRYAWRVIRRRPGWDSLYGPGALLLSVGGMLVLAGLLNGYLALRG